LAQAKADWLDVRTGGMTPSGQSPGVANLTVAFGLAKV
jgi:hypothetical protein